MNQLLLTLGTLTLGGSAAVAALALAGRSTRRRYGARWRCLAWLLLCLRLAVPLPLMPHTQARAPIQVDLPPPEPVQPAPTPTPAPAPLVFTWPVKGEIVAGFSVEALAYNETMGDWRTHNGLDIAADRGAQVLAAAAGTVSALYQDDLMGTVVEVDHGQGLVSQYANLAATPTVKVGDAVSTGTIIGSVGGTAALESGLASHIHYALLKEGCPVDPADYLPER